MKDLFIYLSGTIRKSHDTDQLSEWTASHLILMEGLFQSKGFAVHFLNPAVRSDDISDEFSLFGRDLLQVYLSDTVLVDMREKREIGVGYEIAFANAKNIPVVAWAEKNSHYRPDHCDVLGQSLKNWTHNWTHPFVSQPSQLVAQTLEDAVQFIMYHTPAPKIPMQLMDYPLPAMHHYLSTQFIRDTEMYRLVQGHARLSEKVEYLLTIKRYDLYARKQP